MPVKSKIYKSASRQPAISVGRVSPVAIPRVSRTKSKRSLKINGAKPKKEFFKGYNYLVENNQVRVAKRIKLLLETDLDELETKNPLSERAVGDFIEFCKRGYFQLQAELMVSYDGYLGADWRLKNKTLINIVFLGGEIVTLGVTSKKHRFTKNLKLSSLESQLKKINIPAI